MSLTNANNDMTCINNKADLYKQITINYDEGIKYKKIFYNYQMLLKEKALLTRKILSLEQNINNYSSSEKVNIVNNNNNILSDSKISSELEENYKKKLKIYNMN